MKETANYWLDQRINTQDIQVPEKYRGLVLDMNLLLSTLESNNHIIIPSPDGSNINVRVKRSGTMSESLAAKFPLIKSYEIILENGVSGRIDINPGGFYAMVVTSEYTYFINPIEKNSTEHISYEKQYALKDIENPFIEKKFKQ